MKEVAVGIVLAALIAFGLWFAVYEVEPDEMTRDCLKSHRAFSHFNRINGHNYPQYQTKCDEYGPWHPNPRYAAWLKRHPGR